MLFLGFCNVLSQICYLKKLHAPKGQSVTQTTFWKVMAFFITKQYLTFLWDIQLKTTVKTLPIVANNISIQKNTHYFQAQT